MPKLIPEPIAKTVPTISLCLIARDEEKFLAKCLNSVKDLVDEIIVVVDSRSKDKTGEIARQFTDKVFSFAWCDDFSAARNESLKHATKDWILILDADEVIAREDHPKIKDAVSQASQTAYLAYELPQLHYTNKFANHPNFVEANAKDSRCRGFKGFYAVGVIRLFKRAKEIFFDYCVHETVEPSLKKLGGKIGGLLVPIHHYHELKGQENLAEKQENYFKLSLQNIKKYPHYAKSYSDAAIYYATYLKDYVKALDFSRRAVELAPDDVSYILNLSYRLRDLGKFDEAAAVLNNFLRAGGQQENKCREDERIYRALGFCYFSQNIYQKAIQAYEKALALGSPAEEQIKHNLSVIQLKKNVN